MPTGATNFLDLSFSCTNKHTDKGRKQLPHSFTYTCSEGNYTCTCFVPY